MSRAESGLLILAFYQFWALLSMKLYIIVDTFDGAKPRFLNRGKKRRSVSTLSIPGATDRESNGLILFRVFYVIAQNTNFV